MVIWGSITHYFFPIGKETAFVITKLNEGKCASGENFIATNSHKSCQKNNDFKVILKNITKKLS